MPRSVHELFDQSKRRIHLFGLTRGTGPPDRHLSLTMSGNDRASINHVSYFFVRKFTFVVFGDLRQIRGNGLQGLCAWAISTAADTMARHARDFIFYDSQMRIVSLRVSDNTRRQSQRDHKCRNKS